MQIARRKLKAAWLARTSLATVGSAEFQRPVWYLGEEVVLIFLSANLDPLVYVAGTLSGHFMDYVLLVSPSVLPFPVAVIKHSDKSNLRKKGFILAQFEGTVNHGREATAVGA